LFAAATHAAVAEVDVLPPWASDVADDLLDDELLHAAAASTTMAIDIATARARRCLERSPRPGERMVISGPSHFNRDEQN
jgi:hypothetical protein